MAIGALIAVSVAVFFTGNAVLESSIGGIQRTFSEHFTADLSVSARSDQSFSLFGSDIPVIGDYESQPILLNADRIGERVAKVPGVEAMAYVMSSPLLVETGGARSPGLGLGVIGDEYFGLFRTVRFISGQAPAPGSSGWVVITEERAKQIEKAQGRSPAAGDRIQLSMFRNQSFAIREAVLAGVIRYEPSNDALSRVVITDGRILRALGGFSQTDSATGEQADGGSAAAASDGSKIAGAADDIDSLFSGSPATAGKPAAGETTAPVSIEELRRTITEAQRAGAASEAAASALGHDGAWHFILIRTAAGADRNRIADAIRAGLSGEGMQVLVRDWRGTAGAVAVYVFAMKVVFDIGIIMVAVVVLMLTMNSLVVSVFERTAEIGTMRAVGAQRRFVRMLFVIETVTLSLVAGLLGLILGSGAVSLIRRIPLHFSNQILVLLFGGNSLHPQISAGNMVGSFIAVLVLGTVAWIYPVRLALKIEPIRAIQHG